MDDARRKNSSTNAGPSLTSRLRSKLKLRTRLKQIPKLYTAIREAGVEPRDMVIAPGRQGAKGILVVSNGETQCGIHEYGLNIVAALQKSSSYSFSYAECSNQKQLRWAVAQTQPSAIIYNCTPFTMPWLTSRMTRRFKIPSLGIMHEVTQEEADKATQEMFDYHLCPDPTMIERSPFVFKTARLIPSYVNDREAPAIVTIGSFGFGFADKGFERLMETVHREFDEARILLQIPFNDLVSSELQREVRARIEESRLRFSKGGRIEIVINHQFLSKAHLLDFLASNTLNAFFYDTDKHRGISSTIEHALAVRRPIAITKCGMFRHISSANPSICIEDSSLKRIITNGVAPLEPFYDAWSERSFVLSYERVLDEVFRRETTRSLSARA